MNTAIFFSYRVVQEAFPQSELVKGGTFIDLVWDLPTLYNLLGPSTFPLLSEDSSFISCSFLTRFLHYLPQLIELVATKCQRQHFWSHLCN